MQNYNSNEESDLLTKLLDNPLTTSDNSNTRDIKEEKPNKLIDLIPEENRQRAFELADQINYHDSESLTSYGVKAQEKLLSFSESMIDQVRKEDLGEVGAIINDLMKKLEYINPDDLNPEKKSFFARIFNKLSSSFQEMLSKYEKTGAQIDRITLKLQKNQDSLAEDITLLEGLYENNKNYFDALNIYIAAGEIKLEQLNDKIIPQLKSEAEMDKNQMAVQKVNDIINFSNRLDKRIYDLKLSREITIQSAPQIRLIQNTNRALVEKIQSSILTAIPLWKNQVAIALTLMKQRHAVEAQKQVSKTTNDLLLKNAELLKTNMLETARENERGIVDIETLKTTQESLINTLQETLKIQLEGRSKRRQAETELEKLENELKENLLKLS